MSGRPWQYPQLWEGCVGAWSPSRQRWPSATLVDYSAENNNGTLTNMDAASDWITSGGSMSLDFDGTNDVVEVNDSDLYTNTYFSLSFWFNLTSTSEAAFISKRVSAGTEDEFTVLMRAADLPGTVQGISFRVNGSTYIAGYQWTYATNEWHAVTAICRGTTTEVWFDGNIGGFTASSVSVGANGTAKLRFGALGDSLALPLSGKMDSIMFHARALSSSEVRLLHRRRGIAYDRMPVKHRKGAAAAAASTSGNLLLLGVG